MKILQGDVWKRRGMSLLWGGGALSTLALPQDVLSIRQFFAMVGKWPDDLPCNCGNTLVVAGLAAIIHKFGVSVDFLRKFRAESVFRCDYKASKLVEPNRDEARAPSGNSSARRGLYICVGAESQGTVRWDTDGASVMRRAFVRDKTMPGAPRCDEKFPEPGHRF